MIKNEDPDRSDILRKRLDMIYRCSYPKHSSYKYYGGRGIKVCDEWIKDKESFYIWAKTHGYKKGLEIDRIDSDGNYEPLNCRWVTKVTNNRNKRNNVYYNINGESHTLKEWCEIKNIDYNMVEHRVYINKWNVEKAINTPSLKPRREYTIGNETKKLIDWVEIKGIKKTTFYQRLRYGYTPEEALSDNFKEISKIRRLNKTGL